MARYPNLQAADRTVKAMRGAGLLEDVDAALVELVRSTARALDDALEEGDVRATAVVGRSHLAALDALRSLSRDDADDLSALVDRIASMGDTAEP